jgi:hypothetical protein
VRTETIVALCRQLTNGQSVVNQGAGQVTGYFHRQLGSVVSTNWQYGKSINLIDF